MAPGRRKRKATKQPDDSPGEGGPPPQKRRRRASPGARAFHGPSGYELPGERRITRRMAQNDPNIVLRGPLQWDRAVRRPDRHRSLAPSPESPDLPRARHRPGAPSPESPHAPRAHERSLAPSPESPHRRRLPAPPAQQPVPADAATSSSGNSNGSPHGERVIKVESPDIPPRTPPPRRHSRVPTPSSSGAFDDPGMEARSNRRSLNDDISPSVLHVRRRSRRRQPEPPPPPPALAPAAAAVAVAVAVAAPNTAAGYPRPQARRSLPGPVGAAAASQHGERPGRSSLPEQLQRAREIEWVNGLFEPVAMPREGGGRDADEMRSVGGAHPGPGRGAANGVGGFWDPEPEVGGQEEYEEGEEDEDESEEKSGEEENVGDQDENAEGDVYIKQEIERDQDVGGEEHDVYIKEEIESDQDVGGGEDDVYIKEEIESDQDVGRRDGEDDERQLSHLYNPTAKSPPPRRGRRSGS
ncbi:hypothetical protein NKR19_g5698 [Coniochaeta hoffmannii]|uniref:Uncharacterized protein n=1 Tax=Coniochaeta hoffmannii TaxID=91930 RepID=A0AA38VVI8_9PEZI|nr:hypothetical protein NKR19_g5698 [Coniochaeta hoffmannii]